MEDIYEKVGDLSKLLAKSARWELGRRGGAAVQAKEHWANTLVMAAFSGIYCAPNVGIFRHINTCQ